MNIDTKIVPGDGPCAPIVRHGDFVSADQPTPRFFEVPYITSERPANARERRMLMGVEVSR